MLADSVALVAIAGMAAVTYATRVGGLWIMNYAPPSARLEAFLRYFSGSVLVAIIIPAVVQDGTAAAGAIAAAALVMTVTRRALPSMACGVVAAASLRALSGS